MKVLFHSYNLNLRGTTVAIRDYARYNQEILGNESIISYNLSYSNDNRGQALPHVDGANDPDIVKEFQKEFEVRHISGSHFDPSLFEPLLRDIDVAYYMKVGFVEPLPNHPRNCVHSVFAYDVPFGDRFAYISDWLSNHLTNGKVPAVPYIVNLPQPNGDFREKLGISKDKIVFGRLGGYWDFGHNIEWTRTAIINMLNKRDDIVFLMGNSFKWYEHPNLIYLDGFSDLQTKSNFINTCDAMIHSRDNGESFGLAMSEFLYFNKPVLAWSGGNDQNHVEFLKGTGLLYDNQEDLERKILDIKSFNGDYYKIVERFNPKDVMQKFKSVFLD